MAKKQRLRKPSRWDQHLYRLIAAGRYAADWLPEFLYLYGIILSEEGEDAASEWVQRELLYSFKAGAQARFLWIIRLGYSIWRIYQRAKSG